MDVYNQDGQIIRQFLKHDATTEIELEFLFVDPLWARLYGITIFYIAFYRRLQIDYVVSSHTFTKVVVRQVDFNDPAKQQLIRTMLEVKDNSNMLIGLARKHLFDRSDLENIKTSRHQLLLGYKVAEVKGKEFLEKVAENL